MDWLVPLVGALVVLAVAQDVFVTVLFPASGHGLIRRPASRLIWAAFRLVGRRTHGQRRRGLLAYGGPVQVAVTLGTWLVLLVVGWALIFEPALGTGIRATSGPTDTGWAPAIYFSGYSLTTLGTGDVVPTTGLYRILTVTEALMGFATISMVVTYFLSVYTNLVGRNAFANALQHRTRDSGDAAELLVTLAHSGGLSGSPGFFSELTRFTLNTYETHRSYPVLRYFHYRQAYYSLPRILLVTLDSATLIRTALHADRYQELIRSIGAEGLTDSALQLVGELVPGAAARPPTEAAAAAWRRRYERAIKQLGDAGLAVNCDPVAGADAYVRERGQWDAQVRRLARATLYEWDVVDHALSRDPSVS